MIVFLFGNIGSSVANPLAAYDSLEIKTSDEITEDMYSHGFDAYSVGFNKTTISTNTVAENIDVSNGTVSLKIKLTSLPMRGNKDYNVYLTYRGSPLSVTQLTPGDCYSHSNVALNDAFLVTGDIGTCGLGWNVMPGEFSVPGSPGTGNIATGDVGFTCINGQFYTVQKTFNVFDAWLWHVLGEKNWIGFASNLRAFVATPEYKYTFENILDYGPDPEYPSEPEKRRRLDYMLTEMEDRNGNYVRFTWQDAAPCPPAGRIPDSIITPTSHCKFYPKMLDPIYPDRPCWDKFYLIDSLVHWINDGCYKVKFYYTAKHLDDAIEYWYVREHALLDSISFHFEGQKMKPSYQFFYDNNTGELVRFITPDGAEYSYEYETVSGSGIAAPTKYRRIKKKEVFLSEDSKTLVYEYHYPGHDSLAVSSVGEMECTHGDFKDNWSHGVNSQIFGYYPMYKKCAVVMPEGDSIVYWHINNEYLENGDHYRFFEHEGRDEVVISERVIPKARKFIYGKPYKVVKFDKEGDTLELTRLYWAIDSLYLFMPPIHLRPTLKCKAVQKDPSDLEVGIGDIVELYEYNSYDRFGNIREYIYRGDVECTGIGWESIEEFDFPYLLTVFTTAIMPGLDLDKVDNEKISYEDLDLDDSWKEIKHFKHEVDALYIELAEWCEDCYGGEGGWNFHHRVLCNLPIAIHKFKITGQRIGKTYFRYDETNLSNISNPGFHDSEDFGADFKIRGNLTKKIEWTNNSESRTQEYWYDICGNLVKMRDYMGEESQFDYCSNEVFPDTVIYPDGSKEDFDFNSDGQLIGHTDKNEVSREFEYDCYGRLTLDKIGSDVLNKYKYDDFDRIAKAKSFSSSSDSSTIIYCYDQLGRLKQDSVLGDPGEHVIKEYFYDNNGRMNKETALRFNSAANADTVKKTFDALGRVTEIEYPKSSEDPGAEFVTYEYNGNITDVRDEKGYYTTLINDATGSLVEVIDALDYHTYYDYDANGNLIEIEGAEGKFTDFNYNWLGELIRREGPDRGVDSFEYYPDGNLKLRRTNIGDSIYYTYDNLGRLKTKINPAIHDPAPDTLFYMVEDTLLYVPGKSWMYPHRELGRLYWDIEDANVMQDEGEEIRIRFNSKTWVFDPPNYFGICSLFVYFENPADTFGSEFTIQEGFSSINKTWQQDHSFLLYPGEDYIGNTICGMAIQHTDSAIPGYPAHGSQNWLDSIKSVLVITNDSLSYMFFPDTLEEYFYDNYTIKGTPYTAPSGLNFPKGRLTGFQNPNVREVYFYDKFGNLGEKLVIPLIGDIDEQTFKYSYDLWGRLTKLEYPDEYKVEYEYDKLGNISSVEINDYKTINLSSTAAGLLRGINFPGGITDTFAYRPRNWMYWMEIKNIPSANPYIAQFCYNKRGEVYQEVRHDDGPGDIVKSYQYDKLGRLTQDKKNIYYGRYPYIPGYTLIFTYDTVGNRKSVNSTNYTYYSGTNRLKNDGEFNYSYDENGRINGFTSVSEDASLTYDVDGNLVSLNSMETDRVYNYYYKGSQRIRQKITQYPAGTKEIFNYFYDIAGNLILEDDDSETTAPKRYIYAGNRLLATENDGDLHFYHLDRLGSPLMITDEDGNVVKERLYEAFGNLRWSNGTYNDNREFTGKEKDKTGFHYFGARYYSADIGRFFTPDPINLYPLLVNLERPQTLNPYVYCHNDPVNFFDPWGLEPTQIGDDIFLMDPIIVTASSMDPYHFFNYLGFYLGIYQGPTMQEAVNEFWRGQWPDYLNLTINLGSIIGYSINLKLDRYGNVYFGHGPQLGKSLIPLSGSLSAGTMCKMNRWRRAPTEDELSKCLTRKSIETAGGSIIGVQGDYFFGSGWTTEGGVYVPMLGATYYWDSGKIYRFEEIEW